MNFLKENKIAKSIVIAMLVLMGLYDLGGIQPGMFGENGQMAITAGIILLLVGCYYLLNWFLLMLAGKGFLNSFVMLKVIIVSALALWIIRAVVYVVLSLFLGIFMGGGE